MSTMKVKSAAAATAAAAVAANTAKVAPPAAAEPTAPAAAAVEIVKPAEKPVALSVEHVEAAAKASSAVFKGYEESVQYGRDNADAVIKAGMAMAKGLQDLGKTMFGLAQQQVEEAVSASQRLAGAKTWQEAIDIQTTLIRSSIEKMVAETNALSGTAIRIAEETYAPLGGRVTATMERLSLRH